VTRGPYTVSFDQQTIATASGDYDLFELAAADDKPIAIVGLLLANKSEIGDAQDEMMAYSVVRGNATTGNGTSTTPRPLDSADQAASFTAKTVGATLASAGIPITLLADTFNVRAGLNLTLPEIMRPVMRQGDGFMCVRLTTAVTDDLTLSGTLWVMEL
jgi:hypothetical protein